MEIKDHDIDYENVIQLDDSAAASKNFIANVFLWMFLALGISGFFAYVFSHDLGLFSMLYDLNTGHRTGLGTIVLFSPLAFILAMSYGLNRFSLAGLILLFIAFAGVMGISLSFIFLLYTASSLASVFLIAAAIFGVMAVAGYTTHQDLTGFGSLMIMGLVGVIVASVVNYFLHSNQMQIIISYVTVAVFVGLTAYDVQKLKRIGAGIEYGNASAKKYALMGALTLYLDFINLFLSLLQIFGRRK